MTRGEMLSLSDRLLAAALGSPFEEDPFTPGQLLDVAADEVCLRTGCFYDVQPTGLTAGQALYCAPTIYRIKALHVLDAAGEPRELMARTPAEMDRVFGTGWREWPEEDPPRFAVFEGKTRVRLAPAPSVTRAGALVFEGYAATTSKTSGSSAHLWPGEDDECPLPEEGQMAVVYRLCALRCLPWIGRVTEAAPKMTAFEAQYRAARGDLEANTAKHVPKRGGPAPSPTLWARG